MMRSLVVFSALVASVLGHGRVLNPPGRGTMWREGYPTRPNYDDDGVNCGGLYYQWSVNGGKCGICGDSYDSPVPRPHELGGIYGEGIIVARYLPGDILTATVDLTASHQGFWEFKLCPDPERNDQECFDEYPLQLEDGETKYYPKRGNTKYDVTYLLPTGLICDHCVLQWRYTAGNNWGDCKNGTQGLGCGNQEQFGACSDISIGATRSYDGNGLEGEQMPIEFERFSAGSEQAERGSDDLGRSSEQLGRGSHQLPYPLLQLLGHGYLDMQQGVLHLLRDGSLRPRERRRTKPTVHKKRGMYRKKKSKKKTKPHKWKMLH